MRESIENLPADHETRTRVASVILAAGRGSRMRGFHGNKTLLPLVPGRSSYEGSRPILLQILSSLPLGPRALVVNYMKEDVAEATRDLELTYCEQPGLNGTGGALLAARPFIEEQDCDRIILTMGDIPFIRRATYEVLVENLKDKSLMVLGFRPESKRQYGLMEIEGDRVRKIIEWKYWRTYSQARQQSLEICNAGIYAARKEDLLRYLLVLASKPHMVHKEIGGKLRQLEEFFVTDLVEYMSGDGLQIGYIVAEDEEEVMGVDDLTALLRAQEIFRADKTLARR
ncbi:MAG: NTP transferase domain-containing protein [Thermodesulfobacteriota bacterium]|nr:NTP transferase domain-containing protein [Thermodesulfobacteriota bacterium]